MSTEIKAADLRKQLDALNEQYVQLDQKITADRDHLYQIGKQRGELEIEFQRVDAAEKQAALEAGSKGQSSG